jgi:hypothetical protein
MCTLGLFIPFIFSFFLAKDEKKMTTMHDYTAQSKREGNRHSSTKIILVLLEKNEMNKNAFMMFMMDE